MPSKKPKTKTNQTSVQQRRTEKRADLTHLPPTRKAGPAHFCSAWLRPAGCSSAHKEKQKKINLSISQPLSFSRPARATMISSIPRVSTLNKLSLLRCVPFRGYVPNKEREKTYKNERITLNKTKNKKEESDEKHTHMQISDKEVNKWENFKQTNY